MKLKRLKWKWSTKELVADATGVYRVVRWGGRPTHLYRRIARPNERVNVRLKMKGWRQYLYLSVRTDVRAVI